MVRVTPQMVYMAPPFERINLNASLQLNNDFFRYFNMEKIDSIIKLITLITPSLHFLLQFVLFASAVYVIAVLWKV